MTPNPEFDFQLGKNVRLRGWGPIGHTALLLISIMAGLSAQAAYAPLKAGLESVVTRLVSATEKAKWLNAV